MSKLLSIFALVLILAFISHCLSHKDLMSGAYIKKDKIVWYMLSVILIVFVGLRTHINDTGTYLLAYSQMKAADINITDIDCALGENPGFNMVQWLLIELGCSSQTFLLFFSAITNGIFLWFIRKYSQNLCFSLFLFLFFGGYIFTTAAVKQCAATALALVGVDRFLAGKKGISVAWIILASSFHPYALMYLLLPLLTFKPWTEKTYLLLLLFSILGPMLQPLMGTIIDITTLLGESYTIESFSGVGTSVFRFAVTSVPVLISFLTYPVILYRNDRTNNIFLNLTMMQAGIMFIALFGTANYFARLANYFSIFVCISLPWLLSQFDRKGKAFLTTLAIVGYFLFCYYENGILRPFDTQFNSITLRTYISTLF